MSKIQALETGLSLLKWKVPKGKINPNALGYVYPNGNINFQSEEAALEYAKNCVMKVLRLEQPYERGLVIKCSTITADIHGTKNSIDMRKEDLADSIVVHGHPFNSPISMGDALMFIKNKMKKIIAFNTNGEFSSLTNVPHKTPKWYKLLPDKLSDYIKKCYWKGNLIQLKRVTDKILLTVRDETGATALHKKFKNIYKNASKPLRNVINNWLKDVEKNFIGDTSNIPEKIKPLFDKLNESELKAISVESKYTHRLWSKHAKDFDMIYETNYSDDLIKSWEN